MFRVLVADDSLAIHRLFVNSIEKNDVHVKCVEDGNDALIYMYESIPQIVFADLSMPRMGGAKLCEMMKRDPKLKHIPVYFLVNPVESFNEKMLAHVGASGYLVKPFDSSELLKIIESVRDGLLASMKATSFLDANSQKVLQSSEKELSEIEDLADLPEPVGLMEVTANNKKVNSSTSTSSKDTVIDAQHKGQPGIKSQNSKPVLTQNDLNSSLHHVLMDYPIERWIKESIKNEVSSIVKDIVEKVVRERILELERELEAMQRAMKKR